MSRAKQRLMREAAEMQNNPHPHLNAAPLEHDIFTWHANIYCPRLGVPFHFVITFTEDYPAVAPKVQPRTYIDHPNVFGKYICLDILTMSEETSKTPYRGWTAAYTVRSLLVQLQCFLFDAESSNAERRRMIEDAQNCVCACAHNGMSPFPFVQMEQIELGLGLYSLCRPARLRSTHHKLGNTVKGDLEAGSVVKVIEIRGERARVEEHSTMDSPAWLSLITYNGRLVEPIVARQGIYKAHGFCKLYTMERAEGFQELREIGYCFKGSVMTVRDFVAYGTKAMCVAESNHFTLYEASEHVIVSDTVLVDMSMLKFKKSFEEAETAQTVMTNDSAWLHELYGLVLDIVFDMCDSETCISLARVHEDFQQKLDTCRNYQMRNFRCFYTLKDVHDPNTILGFGVKCEVMAKKSRATKHKRDVLQRMHPSFDLMSLEAFEKHSHTTSIWKDVEFDAFLPMYLCPEHGRRALPAAEKCIAAMWKLEDPRNSLSLNRLLETFAKLMNTTIVNMMMNVADTPVEEIQLFDSIKALEGYMSFHHLLLAFTQRNPALIKLADEKVKNFIEEKANRDKEVTPDLGELIACLSISSYKWEDFLPALMDELFQRNARWILAKYPGLRNFGTDGKRSCIRLTQSFQATITGKRLGMFQRFFMKEIACPPALEGNPDKCKILFQEYNSRFGRPVPGMARRLQLHSRKVLAASNWWDYFDLVGFCPPSSVSLTSWLRNSIRLSAAREYHSTWATLKYTENHVEPPSYDLHRNHRHCMCAGGSVFNLDNVQEGGECLLKPTDRIDIAFVIDCTGSMTSWLHQAKRQIQSIISTVTAKTQFKKVRFALVAYRDHGHEAGYGKDSYVTKKYEFTSDVSEMQNYVNQLRTGGGGDCEALSEGLFTAAKLHWNDSAMRIIVHIGDQCPHGMGSSYDSYPEGNPEGNDGLAITHSLAKKGVVIYNVDCGYGDGRRETFYHTMSFLTGGICVNLSNAEVLSDIVVAATMEEEIQNKLALEVVKIYDDVVARHPGARNDQLVYEITQRLKMMDVQVKGMLGGQNFTKYEMKQIECMAFCTELAQIKAMEDRAGEYFGSFHSASNQIGAESWQYASERQVRTCLKRLDKTLSIKRFQEHGCQYATQKWRLRAFKARWEPFKEASENIGKFRPWKPLTNDQLMRAAKDIKVSGELARKGTKCFSNRRAGIKASIKPPVSGKPNWNSLKPQEPVRTQEPPLRAQQPPVRTQQPPLRAQQPPVRTQQPPLRAQQPPVQTQQPPLRAQQPPKRAQPSFRVHVNCVFQPGPIGLTVNDQDGRIDAVMANYQGARAGVRPGWQLVLVNNMPYSTAVLADCLRAGGAIRMKFARPIHEACVFRPNIGLTLSSEGRVDAVLPNSQAAAAGVRVGWKIRKINGKPFTTARANSLPKTNYIVVTWDPSQRLQLPGPLNAGASPVSSVNSGASSVQQVSAPITAPVSTQNSRSSSGSTPDRSHSRTPERAVRPAQVDVPDLTKSVQIRSRGAMLIDTHAIMRQFQYAGIFPTEIKLVNSKMAYAIFGDTLSAGLASITNLGPNLKLKLGSESK